MTDALSDDVYQIYDDLRFLINRVAKLEDEVNRLNRKTNNLEMDVDDLRRTR